MENYTTREQGRQIVAGIIRVEMRFAKIPRSKRDSSLRSE
jgi:hypothetical protein